MTLLNFGLVCPECDYDPGGKTLEDALEGLDREVVLESSTTETAYYRCPECEWLVTVYETTKND